MCVCVVGVVVVAVGVAAVVAVVAVADVVWQLAAGSDCRTKPITEPMEKKKGDVTLRAY